MIKKILGFDCSSTTAAYAVLTLDDKTKEVKFISADYIKPIKEGSILERLADTRDKIQQIIDNVKPDEICIEDIILFIRNKSTAQTIVTLAVFNRMLGLLCHDYLGRAPHLYGVLAIRHGLKPGKVFPSKEDMPEIVAWHLNIDFPYEMNKKNKIKVESYDLADAMAVALFHALELGGKTYPSKDPPKIIKPLKESKKKVKRAKKNGKKSRISKVRNT